MEDGPPRFTQGFSCLVLLRIINMKFLLFNIQGYHLLWLRFPANSTIRKIFDFTRQIWLSLL